MLGPGFVIWPASGVVGVDLFNGVLVEVGEDMMYDVLVAKQ